VELAENWAAFLSYAHRDDEHDNGRITEFGKRLSGEVRVQTGEEFSIFQDRRDIEWGENWHKRIKEVIDATTFLIPILTPSYFRSEACLEELEIFLKRERKLKRNDLILPVIYIPHQILNQTEKSTTKRDRLARTISQRQCFDWCPLRLRKASPRVYGAYVRLAVEIGTRLQRTKPEMQQNQTSFQQETGGIAEESLVQCVKGGEVISPREMVGYLRAREEGVELPPGMEEHLRTCRTCADNWEFIQRIDPNIRQFRKKRVNLLISEVLAGEDILAATPADRKSDLPTRERKAQVREVQQESSQAQNVPEQDIPNTEELRSDDILKVCEAVRGIEDDKKRYEAAKKLSQRFELRVELEQASGANIEAIFETLFSESDPIDLSALKGIPDVTAGMATAFIASFPHASYFRDPSLLERDKSGALGDKIWFHRSRFTQMAHEFDQARARFGDPKSTSGVML
jgi:hypothetical protein